MHSKSFGRAMALASVLVACACTKDNFPTQSKSNTGTLTANIGGATHQSQNTFSLLSNGTIEIRGANSAGRELHLHIADNAGVGVISLGGGSSNSFGEYTYDTSTWVTDPLGNTGTITITSRTSSHVTGTFSFTMYILNTTNHASSLAVTNGVFDVDL